MRILLNTKTIETLSNIQKRINELNPDTEQSPGPFLVGLIGALEGTLTKKDLETIAPKLTSEKVRKRRIEERLLTISKLAKDEAQLEKIERILLRERGVNDV